MPINRVTIVGNLTRDPERKALPSGATVVEFGVAVNERVPKPGTDGGYEDRASFFDVSVFGKSAEACARFLGKGRQVAIDGRLRQERWQNQAGENRSRIRVIAQEVQFIGGRDDAQGGSSPQGQGTWGGQTGAPGTTTPPPPAQGDWGAGPTQQAPPPQPETQPQGGWPNKAVTTIPEDDQIPF